MASNSTKRQFSTASLRILANDIDNHVDPSAVNSVLRNLASIDRQIHDDFNSVRAELKAIRCKYAQAQKDLKDQRARFIALEQENSVLKSKVFATTPANVAVKNNSHLPPSSSASVSASKPFSSAICNCRPKNDSEKVSPRFFLRDHAPSCALRCALLASMPSDRLCDLVLAREDAWRNQQILVDRLKLDNRLLRATYDNLWSRYQALHNHRRCGVPDTPSSSLSVSLPTKTPIEELDKNLTTSKPKEDQNKLKLTPTDSDCNVSNTAKASNSVQTTPTTDVTGRLRSSKARASEDAKVNMTDRSDEQQEDVVVVGADRLEYLSLRVAHAGKAAVDIASRVEERLKLTARDVSNFRQSLSQAATSKTSSLSSSPTSNIRSPTLSMRVAAPTTPRSNDAKSFRNAMSVSAANIDIIDTPVTTPPSSCVPWQRPGIHDEYEADDMASEFPDNENEENMVETQKNIGSRDGHANATDELMRTMALQQDAHEQLRATVVELTAELARIDPALLADASRSHQRAQEAQQKLDDALDELKRKDVEVVDLRRQLTKVIAEYEAVSVAHSYSNAELSKIRANNRERTKHDQRQGGEGRSYARALNVLETVENNKHHRRIHFR